MSISNNNNNNCDGILDECNLLEQLDLNDNYSSGYCANCGVVLLSNKCASGCTRIKKGHRNLPFLTQAIANTITFANRHNHPGASNKFTAKYGKKWEDVTNPCVLARL